MSDLFTTLAHEAVGAATAVAPRGRSRFEAPSLPLNLAPESEEAAAAGSDAPPSRTASPRPEIRTEQPQSAVAQSAAQASRTVSHERIHRVEVANEIVSRIELRDEPARAGREPVRETPEPVRAAPESARAVPEPVRPVHEPAKAASALHVPAPATAGEPAHFAAIREDAAGQAAAARATSPEAPVAPQRHVPPQVETILPPVPEAVRPDTAVRAQGEPARAQPSPAPRRQAAAPPAIHVTIGRVEVRAVTPQAAKPAPAAPKPFKPALSLADYLEQRNRSG